MIHVDRIRTSSFRHRGVTRRIFVFLGSRTLKNRLKVVLEYAAGTKGYAVLRVIDISRSKFGGINRLDSNGGADADRHNVLISLPSVNGECHRLPANNCGVDLAMNCVLNTIPRLRTFPCCNARASG
jgi:hypothetical protein